MRHRTTDTLTRYFNRIRAHDDAPMRRDINPADITGILPDVFMLESVDNRWFRFRLAGTRLCAILGQEARGAEFTLFWSADDRRRVTLAAQSLLAQQRPLIISARDTFSADEYELALFPLRSSPDTCDRIFGSMSRFETKMPIQPGARLSIVSMQFITDDDGVEPRPLRDDGVAAANVFVRSRGVQFQVITGGRAD